MNVPDSWCLKMMTVPRSNEQINTHGKAPVPPWVWDISGTASTFPTSLSFVLLATFFFRERKQLTCVVVHVLWKRHKNIASQQKIHRPFSTKPSRYRNHRSTGMQFIQSYNLSVIIQNKIPHFCHNWQNLLPVAFKHVITPLPLSCLTTTVIESGDQNRTDI